MSTRFKKHPNYEIGYADGLAGHSVSSDFRLNPPYCEGYLNGESFRKALEKRKFKQVPSKPGFITFSLKL